MRLPITHSRIPALHRPPVQAGSLQHGFSLIEILVTLIIVAIGLLGLAATQATMQQADFESYERAQALVLANDEPATLGLARRHGMAAYGLARDGRPV